MSDILKGILLELRNINSNLEKLVYETNQQKNALARLIMIHAISDSDEKKED